MSSEKWRIAELVRRIGENLRAARIAAGMTMRCVSAESGVAVSHLCRIEQGVSTPCLLLASRLAGLYGTTVDGLLAERAK